MSDFKILSPAPSLFFAKPGHGRVEKKRWYCKCPNGHVVMKEDYQLKHNFKLTCRECRYPPTILNDKQKRVASKLFKRKSVQQIIQFNKYHYKSLHHDDVESAANLAIVKSVFNNRLKLKQIKQKIRSQIANDVHKHKYKMLTLNYPFENLQYIPTNYYHDLLEILTPIQQSIIELIYIYDLTYEEVADQVNLTYNQLRRQHFQANLAIFSSLINIFPLSNLILSPLENEILDLFINQKKTPFQISTITNLTETKIYNLIRDVIDNKILNQLL